MQMIIPAMRPGRFGQDGLTDQHSDPRLLDFWDRFIEGLRKAGMPET